MTSWLPTTFLLALTSAIVLVDSRYVGDLTIYAKDAEAARLQMHEAILRNQPPSEGWAGVGANGLNVRIATIYLSEGFSRVTGLPVLKVYKLIDMASLLAALLCLERFLARWGTLPTRMIAILFVGMILPMTYAFHYFHPWDRLGWLAWIICLWALANDRFGLLVVGLAAGMLIKYDVIVVALLYPMVWFDRHDERRRIALRTVALLILCFGVYFGLRWLLPGGFTPRDYGLHISRNVDTLLTLNVGHPLVLGFGLPTVLAIVGWRDADRFARSAAVIAVPLLALFFLQTNFNEIRAQMGALTLLMPAATCGLQRLLARGAPYDCRPKLH